MKTRRSPYSKLKKENRIRPEHAKGMGDVVFLGFQCLNPECENYIFVEQDEVDEDFDIECPECGFHHRPGEYTTFFDYKMIVEENGEEKIYDKGDFSIFHEEYIENAMQYKYCVLCNTLKPLSFFHKHSSRKSGRQSECIQCKTIYNSIKNGTRKTDQHREASQKRRLLLDIVESKMDSTKVYKKYGFKCFKCGKDLSEVQSPKDRPIDHTLPLYYLWPYNTDNATLLCRDCNGEKTQLWPSDYYNDEELKELSALTGFRYKLLKKGPKYNPKAIKRLKDEEFANKLIKKYSNLMEITIIPLRNRLLNDLNFDFFEVATEIADKWVEKANKRFKKKYG